MGSPAATPASATVLLVEDDDELAELYATWLEGDYAVRRAADGAEALAALDDEVDVALLDRDLPGASGDGALEHVRANRYDCRVAMVTAAAPDFDVLELGFDDYLRKPVDREELRRTVEDLLARSTYRAVVRSYFAAVRKRELLRQEHPETRLTESEQFRRLDEEVAELRRRSASLLGDLDAEDYRALFHDLGAPGPGGRSP